VTGSTIPSALLLAFAYFEDSVLFNRHAALQDYVRYELGLDLGPLVGGVVVHHQVQVPLGYARTRCLRIGEA
jgi:hypothetical protein